MWKKHKAKTQETEPDGKKVKTSLYVTYFTRNVSPLVSSPLIKYTKITANQVTWLMLLVGMIGAYLLTLNAYWAYATGGAVILFHYILDAVDGEVARARKMSSNRGRFLDLIGDNTVRAFIFLGAGIGVYRGTGQPIYLVLAMLATIGFFMSETSYLTSKLLKMEKQIEKINTYEFEKPNKKSFLIKMLELGAKVYRYSFVFFFRTEMYFIILFVGIFNVFDYWLIFYGIMSPINGFFRMIVEYFNQ